MENIEYSDKEVAGFTEIEEIKREILSFEENIDKLHSAKREKEKPYASPEGLGFVELMSLSKEWLRFVEDMDKVSAITGVPEKDIQALLKKAVRGELNDEGEEENLNKLAELKSQFDKSLQNNK